MKTFTKEEVIKLIKSLDSSYGSCDEDSRVNSAWYSGFNAAQESMIKAVEGEDKKPVETFSGVTIPKDALWAFSSFSNGEIPSILYSKLYSMGVDTTRKIKISEHGGIYYVD